MDTTAYIKQQLNARIQNRPKKVKAVQNVIPEKEKPKFIQAFLGFCIILVAVATIFGLIAKGMGVDFKQLLASNETTVVESTEVIVDRPTVDPDMISDRQWKENLEARLDEMESGYRVWKHRTWLLGLANNENAHILKSIHGDRGYIVFDDLWKINKMPETMSLTPEQRQGLQRDDIR